MSREGFDAKLRAVEAWLTKWEVPYRLGSSLGAIGKLCVSFAEEKFAWASEYFHGGRAVSAHEIAAPPRSAL